MDECDWNTIFKWHSLYIYILISVIVQEYFRNTLASRIYATSSPA